MSSDKARKCGILPIVIHKLLLVDIFESESYKTIIIIVMALIMIINYFLLVYDEKYRLIADQFKNELESTKRRNALLLWLYVIASFGIIIVIVIL